MKIKRDKYNGNFDHCLEQSRDLTERICNLLDDEKLFPNIFCQDQFDQFPFVGNGGKKNRFADVLLLDLNVGETFFIEAKDFASLVFYDCTGLPQVYVDTKLKPFGMRNVYLVFKENIEAVTERIRHDKEVFFVKTIKKDGVKQYSYIPYGERLDILMRNRNFEAEEKVKSKLSQYRGEQQYIWNLKACKPIKQVFLRDFGNTNLGKNQENKDK